MDSSRGDDKAKSASSRKLILERFADIPPSTTFPASDRSGRDRDNDGRDDGRDGGRDGVKVKDRDRERDRDRGRERDRDGEKVRDKEKDRERSDKGDKDRNAAVRSEQRGERERERGDRERGKGKTEERDDRDPDGSRTKRSSRHRDQDDHNTRPRENRHRSSGGDSTSRRHRERDEDAEAVRERSKGMVNDGSLTEREKRRLDRRAEGTMRSVEGSNDGSRSSRRREEDGVPEKSGRDREKDGERSSRKVRSGENDNNDKRTSRKSRTPDDSRRDRERGAEDDRERREKRRSIDEEDRTPKSSRSKVRAESPLRTESVKRPAESSRSKSGRDLEETRSMQAPPNALTPSVSKAYSANKEMLRKSSDVVEALNEFERQSSITQIKQTPSAALSDDDDDDTRKPNPLQAITATVPFVHKDAQTDDYDRQQGSRPRIDVSVITDDVVQLIRDGPPKRTPPSTTSSSATPASTKAATTPSSTSFAVTPALPSPVMAPQAPSKVDGVLPSSHTKAVATGTTTITTRDSTGGAKAVAAATMKSASSPKESEQKSSPFQRTDDLTKSSKPAVPALQLNDTKTLSTQPYESTPPSVEDMSKALKTARLYAKLGLISEDSLPTTVDEPSPALTTARSRINTDVVRHRMDELVAGPPPSKPPEDLAQLLSPRGMIETARANRAAAGLETVTGPGGVKKAGGGETARSTTSKAVEMSTFYNTDNSQKTMSEIARNWRRDLAGVWSRALTDLPVHTDMPRICGKITVFVGSDEIVGDYEKEGQGDLNRLQEVISGIASAVIGPKAGEECLAAMKASMPEQEERSNALKAFLTTTQLNPRVVSTLKLCHQRIIFPAYYFLKDSLGTVFGDIRDNRGKWWIVIDVLPSGEVCVTHRKGQRSALSDRGETLYEFEWELRLVLDKTGTQITSCEVCVPETPVFHAEYSLEKQRQFIALLKQKKLLDPAAKDPEEQPAPKSAVSGKSAPKAQPSKSSTNGADRDSDGGYPSDDDKGKRKKSKPQPTSRDLEVTLSREERCENCFISSVDMLEKLVYGGLKRSAQEPDEGVEVARRPLPASIQPRRPVIEHMDDIPSSSKYQPSSSRPSSSTAAGHSSSSSALRPSPENIPTSAARQIEESSLPPSLRFRPPTDSAAPPSTRPASSVSRPQVEQDGIGKMVLNIVREGPKKPVVNSDSESNSDDDDDNDNDDDNDGDGAGEGEGEGIEDVTSGSSQE